MSEEDWKLKVQVRCPECEGAGFLGVDVADPRVHYPCSHCKGSGKVLEKVPPKEIAALAERPKEIKFACCGCRKGEVILRPLPHQVPFGWINWNGDVLCHDCMCKVVLAAVMGANQKVQQLKEAKSD